METNRRPIVVAVGVATALFVAILAGMILYAKKQPTAAAKKPQGKPESSQAVAVNARSAKSEGETWTHRDLIAHLKQKGVEVEGFSSGLGSRDGPAMWLIAGPLDESERNGISAHMGTNTESLFLQGSKYERVYVQKRTTSDSARDEAGTTENGFSWGRFLIMGTPSLATRIRAALP